MKSETLQDQLKRVGREWEDVAYERIRYTNDTSTNGQRRWQELWDRGQELEKQYNKLKKGIENASMALQPSPARV